MTEDEATERLHAEMDACLCPNAEEAEPGLRVCPFCNRAEGGPPEF